jgi:hypothetical protein
MHSIRSLRASADPALAPIRSGRCLVPSARTARVSVPHALRRATARVPPQLIRRRTYRRRTGVPREIERGPVGRKWAYVHEQFRKFALQTSLHAGTVQSRCCRTAPLGRGR